MPEPVGAAGAEEVVVVPDDANEEQRERGVCKNARYDNGIGTYVQQHSTAPLQGYLNL